MIHLWSARNGSNFPASVHPDYITIDQHLWNLWDVETADFFPGIQHPTLQITQDPSCWQVGASGRGERF